MKSVLAAALSVLLTAPAFAQKLPVPGQKNPAWVVEEIPPANGMPLLRAYAVPDPAAPTPTVAGGQYDAKTGELLRFYDRTHGIFYDLADGLLEDRTTGKHYRFYRRGEEPRPVPSRVKYL